MSTDDTGTHIAHTAVVAAAACAAALMSAGPASAERKTVVYDWVFSHCRAADDCDMVQVPFEVETGTQTVLLSNVPNNPGNKCARAVAEFFLGGQRLLSRYVGPGWEQPPFTMNAAPGKHALGVRILNQSDCPSGDAGDYTARLTIWEDVQAAPPPAQQAPAPKQGPLVTASPGLSGVTFHVTDRSGVASQCTYSSEGFTQSFGLPANGTFDLFVPAVRLFKTRTGTITCDNGTSTNTSVFY
ncbi:hypothetical protein CQY20_13400 [Mycolicibacterium agri]|uniref:Secreted protein n=1 Tax=Mycolicibacterium agri TaxID=36811 RepID=A0A2A7N3F1_MYCAG|nr:hypothetical protein [Mycolicibacterium agri]PEG38424.1 hypothetical protein CQY20_13400 [Mycolicibacterium agri]GFG53873.1 hypothetical protein MAGR_53140 [Mycolicibacterium agri]